MQRGRGTGDDFFGFGDPFGGFGGFGGFSGFGGVGRPVSLMSSFFGGRDPFDDPFFTRPFESMMGPGLFGGSLFGAPGMSAPRNATYGGFLEHEPSMPNKSNGPIIKELSSDGEEHEEEDQNTREKMGNPRKHSRTGKEPYVVEPDEDVEGPVQGVRRNNSFFFQSSTVSYGCPNGSYYTSSTTRRGGGDGVILEENKEADSTTGKASHRVSRGIHSKGHSVTRKLNSDGSVDTLQALHNLNEDELTGFEETWNDKARDFLPEWRPALDSGSIGVQGNNRHRRMALPSTAAPVADNKQSNVNNRSGRMDPHARPYIAANRRFH
ncbi:hypothetical protein HPP92_014981 [Vanilla planifolia]|uniref:Glycine-rich protein n=1 Tax=Vanilla planifolia TaxID=51239 RepID=A0A835URL5_VANPL|nr:hypothetical protein HPP92_014981 [Vanilla planifolia]